ncbi:MAG: hypothetical protein JWL81_2174 [Verrucomicrobiales bacterium]|nr:hypothetical protein [Verrucomicrobiales bacterium]
MDPLLLDRSAARQSTQGARKEHRNQRRSKRANFIDGLFRVVLLGVAGAVVAAAAYWTLKIRENRLAAKRMAAVPAAAQTSGASSGPRVLAMMQSFLAASDAEAKSAFVLDSARVLPLMKTAYAAGRIEESGITFGVPQPVGTGVLALPIKAPGPPEILLQVLVRDLPDGPRLDWETYEQELNQRFLRFVEKPGSPGGDFRMILERSHPFDGVRPGVEAVRLATPGGTLYNRPVVLGPEAAAPVTAGLPWNKRRRALVRLEWTSEPGKAPAVMVRELVRWDFLP